MSEDPMRADHSLVHDYFAGVTAGNLPDDLLTADMTAWLTTREQVDKATYQAMIRDLAKVCATPLTFTIDSITAEQDRVVAETRSQCVLASGDDYAMTYVFVFRIRDGRIASVAEHYNPLIVQDKIMPLLIRLREGRAGR